MYAKSGEKARGLFSGKISSQMLRIKPGCLTKKALTTGMCKIMKRTTVDSGFRNIKASEGGAVSYLYRINCAD